MSSEVSETSGVVESMSSGGLRAYVPWSLRAHIQMLHYVLGSPTVNCVKGRMHSQMELVDLGSGKSFITGKHPPSCFLACENSHSLILEYFWGEPARTS
ncbi:rCG43904 [Rattus norvegicus]|uniref:RCG43904 n=1 Tax=Rattus norvegicus TaxID=10116 RepID=A6J7D0_RAT|nr:rCG43904 [Rattus norvegicus]